MVALPKEAQAAKDAAEAHDDKIDGLLHLFADSRRAAFLAQRRAARIREGREWAGVVAVVVLAVWAIRHWSCA